MHSFQSRLAGFAVLLLVLATFAVAQDGGNVTIYNESDRYEYHGCFNETTEIEGSAQQRALANGINEVRRGAMTVPMCLDFCSEGDTEYRYAGLQWSQECWCSQVLSGIAAELDDRECNFPCAGNDSIACGGSLKLSVYRLDNAASGVRFSGAMVVSVALAAALLSTAL